MILLPFILATVAGYTILNIFLRKDHTYLGEYGLYSFFVGIFSIGFVLFFLLVMGTRLNIWWNTGVPLIIIGIWFFFGRKTFFQGGFKSIGFLSQWGKLSIPVKVVLGVLSLLILHKVYQAFFLGAVAPTYFDDCVRVWNFKAKYLFFHPYMTFDPKAADYLTGSFNFYPIIIPVIKYWYMSFVGYWQESFIDFLQIFAYIWLLLGLFFQILRRSSIVFAFLGAYLLSTISLLVYHAGSGYADILIALFLFLSIVSILNWRESGSKDFLFLSVVFALLGFYTKSEGIYLILVANILTILVSQYNNTTAKEKWGFLKDYFLVYTPFALPFFLYKWYFHLGIAAGGNNEAAFHLDILPYVWHVVFFEGNYGVFFVFFLMTLVLFFSFIRSNESLKQLGMLSVFFMVYINLWFVFTGAYQFLINQTVVNRAYLMIIPFLVFTNICIYASLFQSSHLKKSWK